MHKAHLPAGTAELFELTRSDKTGHRQMLACRLKVLAHRQDVNLMVA